MGQLIRLDRRISHTPSDRDWAGGLLSDLLSLQTLLEVESLPFLSCLENIYSYIYSPLTQHENIFLVFNAFQAVCS